MRKERSGRDWDGDDDERGYRLRKRAKRLRSLWKVTETEISPVGFINVPDHIWRNEISKDNRN
eukprot:9323291-Ditylum_brightwellii.AAC.1